MWYFDARNIGLHGPPIPRRRGPKVWAEIAKGFSDSLWPSIYRKTPSRATSSGLRSCTRRARRVALKTRVLLR